MDFAHAHKFVERWEGFHDDDPDDPGGETLYGIARNRHPTWGGWETWDQNRVKREQDLPEDARRALHAWRDDFYKNQFWKPLRCQEYPTRRLAVIVYQAAINCGLRRVGRWVQQCLNNAGADLLVDGRIGPLTIAAMREVFERGHIRLIEDGVLVHQRRHYEYITDADPRLGKFLRGWLNRIRAAEAL